MTIKRLVFWIAILAVFAMSARVSIDTDTWWHLASGRWIFENGAIPQVDPFSHTRYGASWHYPGWLSQTPMYLIYRAIGPGGLNLWTALMVTLAFACVWRILSGGPFLRAFTLIVSAAASGVFWAARPYLVTFLFSALFLLILETYHKEPTQITRRRLWWLPLIMLLWANSHGGFAAGFLLWGVYWTVELVSKAYQRQLLPALGGRSPDPAIFTLTWVGLFMLAAVCINPYGPVTLIYPFITLSIGALHDYIQEWQSPDFHLRTMQPFAWLILLLIGVLGASRRRMMWKDFLLVAGFGYMSLMTARNIALFALVAPMVITRHADPLLAALRRRGGERSSSVERRSALNWVILGLLGVAVLARAGLALPREANLAEFRKILPIEAVEAIREQQPAGQLYNSYNWGGYLIWELPEYPVFIDGRTDLYDGPVIEEWLQVASLAPGWEGVLEKYGVNLVLVEAGSTLNRFLERETAWQLIFEDDVSVVFRRAGP